MKFFWSDDILVIAHASPASAERLSAYDDKDVVAPILRAGRWLLI